MYIVYSKYCTSGYHHSFGQSCALKIVKRISFEATIHDCNNIFPCQTLHEQSRPHVVIHCDVVLCIPSVQPRDSEHLLLILLSAGEHSWDIYDRRFSCMSQLL